MAELVLAQCNLTVPLPTAEQPADCLLVLWRHVINTGGPTLRRSFESLALATGRW